MDYRFQVSAILVSIQTLKFGDQTVGILFVVSQEVIRSHLR